MKQSQNQRVLEIIKRDGEITRNQCLRMFPAITRLSARIGNLEEAGYEFVTEKRSGDYVYRFKEEQSVLF